jgi:PII-like signaling protein
VAVNGHDALKLTTYFGERDRVDGRLLADELAALYGAAEIRASVLLRGAEGFGTLHHVHTERLLSLSEDLPVVSIAIDLPERIESLLESVLALPNRGLVTLERASLVGAGAAPDRPPAPAEETKLTVYVGRHERVGRVPAFVAVCQLLHACGVSGATVLLGVDGTRGGQRHRARLVGRNLAVPAMVIAVGATAAVGEALRALPRLLPEPLATLERVRVCKRDGELLAFPDALPGTDDHGRALWQKLSVFTSQAAVVPGGARSWLTPGDSLALALMRALRESASAGATSLHGVWGFHGDHGPHGDRLLQLRRHAPVLTITVDRPEQMPSTFAIVDELTADTGLVISEMVPAIAGLSGSAGASAPDAPPLADLRY